MPLARLKVTQGTLDTEPDGWLGVRTTRMRAVVPGLEASRATLRFKLAGPSTEQRPLGSGELRQQVGLKLRALDGCNVLYVMWRIAPKPGVVVNYKRNPDMHHSHDCGNAGYTTVRPSPRLKANTPAPELETEHTLRVHLEAGTLRVWADDTLAWEGTLPAEALELDGPVGLRSDNVQLSLRLSVPAS
ncbi:hypothetical protein NVS55_22305 [Myxococcus stipitatus]|uniref:hypothetical protein n=1 Tax=Myxococcus stipitatus TaxID=83455 RepID=UPI003145640F